MIRIGQGDADAARPLLETARAALHAAGDFRIEANVLYFLARAALMGGDGAEAQRDAEASLPLYQQAENTPGRALALSALGAAALAQGDTATAVTRFEEAMPLMRATVGPYFLAEVGMAWMEQGDLEQAQHLLAESLRSSRDMGRPAGIALMGLSAVAAARGQPRRAARLLGASEAVRPAGGPQLPPYLHALVDRAVAAARDALGAEAFESAPAEGAVLSQGQAIAEALEGAPSGGKGTGGPSGTSGSD
jgi:tetratricopeptide (TPR) repeat protein